MNLTNSPETLQLNQEQTLVARLEAASHQHGVRYGRHSRTWTPESHPELKVHVDNDRETDDDLVYSVEVLIDPTKPEAGHYKAVASTDGLFITQPGDGRQEIVTDPARQEVLIGGFATKLQAAIEAAAPAEQESLTIFSKLGRFAHRSTELDLAA